MYTKQSLRIAKLICEAGWASVGSRSSNDVEAICVSGIKRPGQRQGAKTGDAAEDNREFYSLEGLGRCPRGR
jgi:hypothetical protein